MTLAGKKVLVTGAGGFIGSHLAEELVRIGAEVRAFVRYNSSGRRGWLDTTPLASDMEIVAGDITDGNSVSNAVRDVDTIFHLAALIGIPYSYAAPASYVAVNIGGTLNILQSAREQGTRRVVQTSTSEVYGTARIIPITEDHPLQGQSPYSASKIGADKIAESFYSSFDLPVVILRPFNTYGPRQSERAVIPTVIGQALSSDSIRLGNITPTRDLVYVGDTARAFMAAGDADGVEGETINAGTGSEISIGDLAIKIGLAMGKIIKVVADEARVRPSGSEVERLCADATKARNLLGWESTNNIDDGLKKTVEWFEANSEFLRATEYTV